MLAENFDRCVSEICFNTLESTALFPRVVFGDSGQKWSDPKGRKSRKRNLKKWPEEISENWRLGKVSLGIQSYSEMMIGVSNHLLSKVFRFHYHSQKVIGSLGYYIFKSHFTRNSNWYYTSLRMHHYMDSIHQLLSWAVVFLFIPQNRGGSGEEYTQENKIQCIVPPPPKTKKSVTKNFRYLKWRYWTL